MAVKRASSSSPVVATTATTTATTTTTTNFPIFSTLSPPFFYVPSLFLSPAMGYGERCKLDPWRSRAPNAFLTILTPGNTSGENISNNPTTTCTPMLVRYVSNARQRIQTSGMPTIAIWA